METAVTIAITRTTTPRPRVAESALGFGKVFTDHMFRLDWDEGKGWHDGRVIPYGPLMLDPAASALHYGQLIFEGMKAFDVGGSMRLFRPRAHAARLDASAAKLCMPPVGEKLILEGVRALLKVDADWLPKAPGTSLYVRPFMIATEAFLGVRPAKQYAFLVIVSPVGAYFSGPPRPLKIWAEVNRSRAAPGGIGASKAAANYVASLFAAEDAKSHGFDQVLWLDAARHDAIEEIGTMNFFARIGGTVVTPSLSTGTILAGVTRDTILELCRDEGVKVEERAITLGELTRAAAAGTLQEAWGTGTASLVAPIGELAWQGGSMAIPPGGGLGETLRTRLGSIQTGAAPDPHGWLEAV
jgi:branched-chain amino acid aminotransferase